MTIEIRCYAAGFNDVGKGYKPRNVRNVVLEPEKS